MSLPRLPHPKMQQRKESSAVEIVGMTVGEGEMGNLPRWIFLLVGKAFCRSGALRRFLRSPKVPSKPRLAFKQVSSVVGHTER